MIPEALAAQQFRVDVLKGRYTILDGTANWFELREGGWMPVSSQHMRNLVMQYCLDKALGSDNQESWEPYLYQSRQSAILSMAALSEQVRKPREFYGYQVPMDKFWDEILIPDPNMAITQKGLYEKYVGFADRNVYPVLSVQTFRKQFSKSNQFIKHRIRVVRLRTDKRAEFIDYYEGEFMPVLPACYWGLRYNTRFVVENDNH